MSTQFENLDVSDLEPPEPLERILVALQSLDDERVLKVRHRREPHPLFPLLRENGFDYLCRQRGETAYRIYIWRRAAGDLAATCLADLQAEAKP